MFVPALGEAGHRDGSLDEVGRVLEVEDLEAEFHLRHATVRAVDKVSFSIGPGECLGLVGESGCGKSTIGLSILKLLPGAGHVTGGSVRLEGRDLVKLSEPEMRQVRGNQVAMIFQDPMTSLNPTWTIGRQIAEPVRLHRGASKAEALERALEVLRLVGMPRPDERIHNYPHQLSGGLRQRVMIAMALACEPKLLIADEPTTALDVTIQAQILDLIDDLRHRLNMAVLLITHDMGVIAARTDRVMVMYAGKVVEAATTDELFATMRHPYSEALFRSIPRLDQDKSQRLYSIPGMPPDLSAHLVGCRFAPRCRYATKECVEAEPSLSSADAAPLSAADKTGANVSAAPTRAASTLAAPASHVFACYHPVPTAGPGQLPMREPVGQAPLAPGPSLTSATSPDETSGPAETGPPGLVLPPASSARPPWPDAGPLWPVRARELGQRELLLRVEGLDKEYTVTAGAVIQRVIGTVKAVSNVSFSLHQGETFGLVGESGCGKTTIGRLVVALERPTRGAVYFEDEKISSLRGSQLRRRRRELQLMFQDPYSSLDPRMRVRSIVREPLVIQHIGTRREQDRRVDEVLHEVGLSPKAANLYPHEFSGGQRQRIGLARALALHPKLIVADEPVSALDVSIQAQILNLMRALQERHDLTYIIISHDLAVVKYLADTIGVMYLGKLVEIGPAADVYAHAAHPYTRGLIDTIPVPDPVTAKSRPSAPMQGELPSAISPPSGCRFRTRCPFAQARCAEEEPALRRFGTGHHAACHFPLQPPLSDEASSASVVPV
ncbi:MAG: dipeptide ABC transporter ATP-binding protein [Acidimicrobiales bacterium]